MCSWATWSVSAKKIPVSQANDEAAPIPAVVPDLDGRLDRRRGNLQAKGAVRPGKRVASERPHYHSRPRPACENVYTAADRFDVPIARIDGLARTRTDDHKFPRVVPVRRLAGSGRRS